MWEELNRPKGRVDPQHLLLVSAVLFSGVAFFALSGLGRSGTPTFEQSQPHLRPPPDRLAAVDETVISTPPVETPVTVVAPPTMAMGLPAALLDSAQSQGHRLYRTALGREPDRGGFEFWSDQVRAGVPLQQLADDFLASVEYQEQFSEGNEWNNRAELLLTNAFGPAADQGALDIWRERFTGLDGSELLLAISEADETWMRPEHFADEKCCC